MASRYLLAAALAACAACGGGGDGDGDTGAADAAPGADAELAPDAAPPAPDASLCGNSAPDPGEACDDGNQTGGDGCRADCLGTEQCGDGLVDVGEYCIPDAPAPMSAVLPNSQGSTFADVDGDGDLDFAIFAVDENFMNGELQFALNDGTGQLGALVGTGTQVFVGEFVDVNGDAKPDHVTFESGMLAIHLGAGTTTFTPSGNAIAAAGPHAFGDLDGDGDLDVVFAGGALGRVFLNDGAGVFSAGDTFQTGVEADGIALGRFDTGASLDVVVVNDEGMVAMGGNVRVFLNAGDASYSDTPIELEAAFPNRPSVADLDADGDDDIVVGNEVLVSGPTLFFNDGAAGFSAVHLPLHLGTQLVAGPIAADLDFDGAAELLGFGHQGARFIKRNDGAGMFVDFKDFFATPLDWNGDGAVDLVGLGVGMDGDLFVEARLADP